MIIMPIRSRCILVIDLILKRRVVRVRVVWLLRFLGGQVCMIWKQNLASPGWWKRNMMPVDIDPHLVSIFGKHLLPPKSFFVQRYSCRWKESEAVLKIMEKKAAWRTDCSAFGVACARSARTIRKTSFASLWKEKWVAQNKMWKVLRKHHFDGIKRRFGSWLICHATSAIPWFCCE